MRCWGVTVTVAAIQTSSSVMGPAVREATAPLLQRIEKLDRLVEQLQHENAVLRRDNQESHRHSDQLRRQIDKLQQHNDQLRRENAQLKKDPSTLPQPPSSDIVKPKKQPAKGKTKRKRRRGALPGHDKHARQMFGQVEESGRPVSAELGPAL